MANQKLAVRMQSPYMQELAAADKKIVSKYFRLAQRNESEASRLMGLCRNSLRKKLELYGLKA